MIPYFDISFMNSIKMYVEKSHHTSWMYTIPWMDVIQLGHIKAIFGWRNLPLTSKYVGSSVTRFCNLLDFGQLLNAFGNT